MPRGTHRLFVAAYPPTELADRLLALLAERSLPKHRAVPPRQIHLTLHFIGDTAEREIDATRESIACSAAGLPSFDLSISGLVSLPVRGDSRTLAAFAVPNPTLLEIHRRLVHRLARKTKTSDHFLPHLTLCRFTPPVPTMRIHEDFSPLPWRITSIRLMRSLLHPAGAEHTAVGRFSLDSNTQFPDLTNG